MKKGEVLISGIITRDEKPMTKVRAEGKVFGEVWYKVNLDFPTHYYEEIKTKKTSYGLEMRIFSKNIVLFNKYKTYIKKDIPLISNVLMFIGKHSMNIFLFHTFIRSYLFSEFTYSFHHFALITLVLLLVSLAVSAVLELIKKYSGYNKLVSYLGNKINNKTLTE